MTDYAFPFAPEEDFLLDFPGRESVPSLCRVRLFETERRPLILFTEVEENPGDILIDAIEMAAQTVCRRYGADPDDFIFVEHQPPFLQHPQHFFDLVALKLAQVLPAKSGQVIIFQHPYWRSLSDEEFKTLLFTGRPEDLPPFP